jgi:hypothetical protein
MDKSCPTFGHFSVHKQKLTKLSQYLTIFPCHFSNIFLKSFRLLPNLMTNCDILQWDLLMRFHKTNNISWNFSSITLCFCKVAKYFVDFWFHFRYFWKMTEKFWFYLKRYEISKFRTWQWWKLKKSQYHSYLATKINSNCKKCYGKSLLKWFWKYFLFLFFQTFLRS